MASRHMMQSAASAALAVKPLSVDDFASLRYLHITALRAQTADVLSDTEIAAFIALVNSPAYTELLMREENYGAWLHGELVGTVSWQAGADSGSIARIGSLFVRHPRMGIGGHLLAAVEGRAQQCGFAQYSAAVTANAVPFFAQQGYRAVSRGIKVLTENCALPVTFLKKSAPHARFGTSRVM